MATHLLGPTPDQTHDAEARPEETAWVWGDATTVNLTLSMLLARAAQPGLSDGDGMGLLMLARAADASGDDLFADRPDDGANQPRERVPREANAWVAQVLRLNTAPGMSTRFRASLLP